MDFSTALLRDLLDLSSSVGLDDAVGEPLTATVAAVSAAAPSYRGMCLTVVENGHPVQVASFVSPLDAASIATSLRLPLAALGPGFHVDSQLVFYAETPGAFVDLAADLGYALDIATRTDVRQTRLPRSPEADGRQGADRLSGHRLIVLDGDLPPATVVSGVTGLDDLSTINRAIGILIDQGHHPDRAHATLGQYAAAAGVAIHDYAARLLRT